MRSTALIAFVLAALSMAAAAGEKAGPTLEQALLGAIRHPAKGQFPEPTSPVKFLLEQVRRQDADEAARVFPIAETYKRVSFADEVKRTQAYTPHSSPTPFPSFHNLSVALRPLELFHRLTLTFLGVSPHETLYVPTDSAQGKLKALETKLDARRLRKLEVAEVAVTRRVGHTISRAKLLGATETAFVDAVVLCSGKRLRCSFVTGKIDGNWRVLLLMDIEPATR